MDLVHVAIGGGAGLFRTVPVLARVQIRRIPIPPIMLGVRYLVLVVMQSCFVEEFRKGGDVHGLSFLPLAAGEPLLDFLHLPAVPIRILKRGKGKVRTP